jgi:hypothetical protein
VALNGDLTGAAEQVVSSQAAAEDPSPVARSVRRLPALAAWVVGCLALTAIFVRISLSARVMSDGATIALQSWDMLHGHLLLHGWQVSDLNCYFIELPVIAIAEGLFHLGDFAQHVGSSFTYMLVTVVAMAAAMTGSRGAARAVRCGIVLAILAAPLFSGAMFLVVEEPDHIGTNVLFIGLFLLIDKFPERRFTAPLVLVILTAGQFDDLTMRYFAVPAVVVVCGYRALAARRFRSADTLVACAAVVSVPLSALFSWFWVRIGGFVTPPLWQTRSSVSQYPHHLLVTWANTRILYGAGRTLGVTPSWTADHFGLICLLAALFGLAAVAWRWRRASRLEQMIALSVVFAVGIYAATGFAYPGNAHDLALLLPSGAVLAARALTPERIRGTPAVAAVTAAALIAALPLAAAATKPNFQPPKAPLAAFLEAHKLTYGFSNYDDGPTVTVLTHNKVQLIPLHVGYSSLSMWNFESKMDWYNPAHHDATFVVARLDPIFPPFPTSKFIRYFGKPVKTYKLDNWLIMVYKKNLLKSLSDH